PAQNPLRAGETADAGAARRRDPLLPGQSARAHQQAAAVVQRYRGVDRRRGGRLRLQLSPRLRSARAQPRIFAPGNAALEAAKPGAGRSGAGAAGRETGRLIRTISTRRERDEFLGTDFPSEPGERRDLLRRPAAGTKLAMAAGDLAANTAALSAPRAGPEIRRSAGSRRQPDGGVKP